MLSFGQLLTDLEVRLFDDSVCFAVRSLNVLKWSNTSVIFQLTGHNNIIENTVKKRFEKVLVT